MKSVIYSCFLLLLITATASLAGHKSRSHSRLKSPTLTAPKATSPVITLSPASATYSVGQSVTVTITNGTDGLVYSLDVFDNPNGSFGGTKLPQSILVDAQGGTSASNSFTWTTGTTSVSLVVRLAAGSEGTDRVLEVADQPDLNESMATDPFEIKAKPALGLTLNPSSSTYSVGQSITATITGGIVGEIYYPSLYNGTVLDANDISLNMLVQGVESPGNTVAWSSTTTSGQWVLQFTPEAIGTNRQLGVSNRDFSHEQATGPLAIVCPPVSISATPSLTVASGGSVTLTASGADSYTWSNGVQSTSVVLTNVRSATTLSVRGTTNTCSATASATVSIAAAPAATSVCVSGGCAEVNGVYVDSEIPTWQYEAFTTLRALKNTSQNSYMLFVTNNIPEELFSQWVIVYYDTQARGRYRAPGSSETIPTSGWTDNEVEACTPITVTMGACPVCSLTVAATPSSQTITSGGSVTLTASGAESYTWSNGVQSVSVVLTNVTSATTLSVTGVTGQCSATASAAVSVTTAAPGTSATICVSGGCEAVNGTYVDMANPSFPDLTINRTLLNASKGFYMMHLTGNGQSGWYILPVVEASAPFPFPFYVGTSENADSQTIPQSEWQSSSDECTPITVSMSACVASAPCTPPDVTIVFPTSAIVNPAGPVVTVPVGTGLSYQVVGGGVGARYERKIVLDRINGFEIRTTMENRDGIFPIDKAGPYTITVTDSNGCSRTVTGEIRGQ